MPKLPVSEQVAAALNDIAKRLGGGEVRVGFLEGATYPETGTPVASVAYWNEFGHGGNFPAPPRPFFRPMIAADSPQWPAIMAASAIAHDNDGDAVLKDMGVHIQGKLIESINTVSVEPLSETTLVLRKKFGNSPEKITLDDVLQAQRDVKAGKSGATGTQAKPLIWTGNMVNSVEFEVKK
jgi:hypothetical protein